ncbi:MAG: sigma-70 family RNA polymerase sigma factor [Steroidobacteraceae bacterium]
MSDAGETDQSLMMRYARGEAEAFEVLYRRHEMRTWRYLERTVGNRATADELMQEVWFAVAREAPNYRATARFTTWLFTIAHNRMIDWMRTNRPQASLETLGYESGSVIRQLTANPSAGPLAAALAQEESAVLAEALAQLPAEQRDALLMQIEGELGVEEIAAISGVSFETAKSRLRYARIKLREVLKEFA